MSISTPITGTTVDHRYRVVEHLADGGMGSIYRALQLPLERPVALKCLAPGLDARSNAWGRFLREARVLSMLRHPHIVSCLDVGSLPSGQPYIVMEYVPGQSLRHRLDEGPLGVEEACEIAHQVALALASAHQAGIIHRDLSPDNILLDPLPGREIHARLIDFGLAGLRDHMSARMGSTGLGPIDLTAPGTRMGTPWYTPPEQSPGNQGDLYSLGIVLFEMIVGRVPFEDADPVALRMAHTWSERPSLRARGNQDAPAALDELAQRLMASQPAQRPRSALEVIDTLKGIARDLLMATASDPKSSPAPSPEVTAMELTPPPTSWLRRLIGG